MTQHFLARIQLPANSGLPRDTVDMDPVFAHADGPDATAFDDLTSVVINFFHVAPTAGSHLELYLAGDRDYATNHARVDYYRIPAVSGHLGSPVATRSWTLTDPGSGKNLPEQVAVALSFHGDLTDIPERSGVIRPAARRRGRIFLGPLNDNALEGTAGSRAAPQTPAATLLSDLGKKAKDAFGTLALSHGWTWEVWSRAAWEFHPVVAGYVDDRFDTQRRRLEETTGRIAFTL